MIPSKIGAINMSANSKRKVSLPEIILITAVGCLVCALNNGVRVNYGLITSAVVSATGIPLASVSFSVAIAQLLYGLAQPLFGVVALKKSNSFAIITGTLMLVFGFLLLPLCHTSWMLHIILGLMIGGGTGAMSFGIIMSAITPIVGETCAAFVSGIINGAGGIGGAILAPVSQALVDIGGLKALMVGLAAISVLILAVSVWLYIKEKYSVTDVIKQAEEQLNLGKTIADALKSSAFLHIAMAFFTCGFFMAIIETHLYSQMLALGVSGSTAALAFTVYGIMGMIGPVIAGFLCVRIRCKWVLGTMYLLRPVAVLVFLLLPKTIFTIFAFVIALGLIGNSTVPPTTNLLSKLYGFQKLGMLSGIAFVFHQIGSFISTWLGGILVSSSGNYTPIWLAGALLAGVAAILSYTIRE